MRDQRYSSRRWLAVRLQVLRRDLYRCRIVDGCTERATLVDHIMPTSLTMPDSLFYSLGNLRAGCRNHNLGRGFTEKPTVVATTDADVVTGDYT